MDQVPPAEEIVHPVQEAFLSASGEVPVRNVTLDSAPDDPPDAFRTLRSFDGHRRWGALSEPSEEVMGSLLDGTVLSDGRIAVVDRNFGVIRIFDSELASLGTLGSSGDGPGEFVSPVSVFEDSAGRLKVGNHLASGIRLEQFAMGPEGFEFEGRRRLPTVSDDGARACALGERVLASGLLILEEEVQSDVNLPFLRTAAFVHVIDSEGSVIGSVSAPYLGLVAGEDEVGQSGLDDARIYRIASDAELALYFSTARLACSSVDGRQRIWVGYSVLGEVHAARPDGAVDWIIRLDDLETLTLSQRIHEFGTAVGPGPGFSGRPDLIESVTLLSPELLAVSVRIGAPSESGRSHRNYFLDAGSGEVLDVFEGAHMILAAGEGLVLLYREDPFPELAAAEFDP